jgi:hypothetical protein
MRSRISFQRVWEEPPVEPPGVFAKVIVVLQEPLLVAPKTLLASPSELRTILLGSS